MKAHMTAHFRGGPWAGDARYQCCERPHGHRISVAEVLPIYDAAGHYELEDDPVSTVAFDELLVDAVYEWIDWNEVAA